MQFKTFTLQRLVQRLALLTVGSDNNVQACLTQLSKFFVKDVVPVISVELLTEYHKFKYQHMSLRDQGHKHGISFFLHCT